MQANPFQFNPFHSISAQPNAMQGDPFQPAATQFSPFPSIQPNLIHSNPTNSNYFLFALLPNPLPTRHYSLIQSTPVHANPFQCNPMHSSPSRSFGIQFISILSNPIHAICIQPNRLLSSPFWSKPIQSIPAESSTSFQSNTARYDPIQSTLIQPIPI